MFRKNSTPSKKNSTKPQRFVSGLKLSRLLNGLAVVALVKLVLIGAITLDISTDYFTTPFEQIAAVLSSDSAKPAPGRQAGKKPLVAATEALAANGDETAGADPGGRTAPIEATEDSKTTPTREQARGMSLERDALMRKQEELNRQEQSLMALQKDIDAKLQNLQELQAKIERMLKQADEMKDKKLKHLVDVYSNMKAKQAAAVLETLDEKISVKILAGMRGRQAGEILTFVNAAKAARLSEALTRLQVPFQ